MDNTETLSPLVHEHFKVKPASLQPAIGWAEVTVNGHFYRLFGEKPAFLAGDDVGNTGFTPRQWEQAHRGQGRFIHQPATAKIGPRKKKKIVTLSSGTFDTEKGRIAFPLAAYFPLGYEPTVKGPCLVASVSVENTENKTGGITWYSPRNKPTALMLTWSIPFEADYQAWDLRHEIGERLSFFQEEFVAHLRELGRAPHGAELPDLMKSIMLGEMPTYQEAALDISPEHYARMEEAQAAMADALNFSETAPQSPAITFAAATVPQQPATKVLRGVTALRQAGAAIEGSFISLTPSGR